MASLRNGKFFLVLGSLSSALGVGAGAFGAHGLKEVLSPDVLSTYETAVRYQMYHAFGMIAAGLLWAIAPHRFLSAAGWCFVAGTVLFSGSLYGLVLSGMRWLGAITPFGGVAFIAGWVLMGLAVFKFAKS
jgi:uncharacterized membrane protein YgdD (TMEM256/DUF423 family)